MARRWVLPLVGVLAVAGIAPAHAIIPFCTLTGQVSVTPFHPGPADPLAYDVSIHPMALSSPDSRYVYLQHVVNGNDVAVDLVLSPVLLARDGRTPFPALGAFGVRGSLDSLPPGDYRIAATIHQYSDTTGSLELLCTAKPPTAFSVFAQPGQVYFGRVVEYRHAGLDQYFITQDTYEQALLDAGGVWQRTGQTFPAYLPGGSDGRGFAVMREYDAPPAGSGTHFFSYGEWPLVYRPNWITETGNAFEIEVPSWPAGTCRAGSMPVYRLWNARRGSGHRYIADAGVKAAMEAQGWVAEGYGADTVYMCAPLPG